MNRRTSSLSLFASLAIASSALTACGGGGGDPLSGDGGSDADTIVVGSANFPESELLMQMYAQALEAQGLEVETQPNIGAREVYMKAFADGDIDLLPEYNGALLAYLQPEIPQGLTTPEEIYDALQDVLPEGGETLPQSAAEDKDTLTVTRETAEEYDLTTIADLAPVAGELTVGAAPEWRERYQGLIGLKELYGVEFKELKPLDAGGELTKTALEQGDIQVANVFSTDSAIEVNDWVPLEDPENLYLAQNIVPLIRSEKVSGEATEALDGVSEALTTENLTTALAKVQVDKEDPATVAADFLSEHGLD